MKEWVLGRQTWLDNYESVRQVWREMWREGTDVVTALITMKCTSLSVILLSHLVSIGGVVTMLPRCRLDLRSGGDSQS
jgi:hypothetical protein